MNARFTDMLGMQILHISKPESTDVVIKEFALNQGVTK
jgi:hypothetical protein